MVGFIGGDGFIAKTLDGGTTWTRVEPTNSFPYVNDIFFQDANIGYVTSGFNGGAVYKTTNGGQTWETVYWSDTPFGIHFNGNTGCIVGEIQAGSTTNFGRTLSITKDGGGSWTAISNAGYDSYSNVSFISDKIGFLSHWPNAYTGNNNYFKTTDGGENWLEHQTNIEGSYNYIKFFDEKNGVMVGDAVLRTEDGGKSWTKYTHEIGHYGLIRELDFVDENLWFLCTYTDGLIYRTTDGGKTFVNISKIENTLISLNFINSQIGFAGSLFGKIYKTTDGGLTWKIVFDDYAINTYTGIFSFDFVNEIVGYASGNKGAIYKTEDGGNSWQYLQGEFVGFSQRDLVDFRKIDFYDENIGYVASYNPGLSRLYKTNDGGKTWFDVQTYDNESFWAVHFFDANKALIAGGDGLILKLESNTLPCKPNLSTKPILDVCVNKDYQYSVTNHNNLSYKWNISGGSITSVDRNRAIVQWNQVGNQRLYVTMINDCGAGEALNFDVMVNDLPIKPTINLENDSTLVSSSLTGNQWLLDGQAIAGETKQVLTIKQTGIYSLRVNNSCGGSLSDTLKIEVITGFNKEIDDKIKIFPNPADDQVNIQLEGNNAGVSIEMLNTMGTSLYKTTFYSGSNFHSIPTNSITPGLYLIKISTLQKTYVRKVLIK
ncbi:YCF48-related protein [Rhodocytophaga aerolata]